MVLIPRVILLTVYRKLGRSLDDTAKSASSRDNETSAFNMFKNMDRKGSAKASEDTSLPTVHQNTITMLREYESGEGGVTKIASCGLDGKIVVWDVGDGLDRRMGGMSLRR
jgi:actin related protein 2/3 complex subunit 1A/1B